MEPAIKCRIYGLFLYMWFGMVCLFTFVAGPLLIVAVIEGGKDSPEAFVFFWFAILAWFWFVALYLFSYEIRLFSDGGLEFKSVLRTRRVNVGDVESIGPWFGGSILRRWSSARGGVTLTYCGR